MLWTSTSNLSAVNNKMKKIKIKMWRNFFNSLICYNMCGFGFSLPYYRAVSLHFLAQRKSVSACFLYGVKVNFWAIVYQIAQVKNCFSSYTYELRVFLSAADKSRGWIREVNNRVNWVGICPPSKFLCPPSKLNLSISHNCPPSKLSKNGHYA